jgi:hypothetical protein
MILSQERRPTCATAQSVKTGGSELGGSWTRDDPEVTTVNSRPMPRQSKWLRMKMPADWWPSRLALPKVYANSMNLRPRRCESTKRSRIRLLRICQTTTSILRAMATMARCTTCSAIIWARPAWWPTATGRSRCSSCTRPLVRSASRWAPARCRPPSASPANARRASGCTSTSQGGMTPFWDVSPRRIALSRTLRIQPVTTAMPM